MNFRNANLMLLCEKEKEISLFNIFFVTKTMSSHFFCLTLTFEILTT